MALRVCSLLSLPQWQVRPRRSALANLLSCAALRGADLGVHELDGYPCDVSLREAPGGAELRSLWDLQESGEAKVLDFGKYSRRNG